MIHDSDQLHLKGSSTSFDGSASRKHSISLAKGPFERPSWRNERPPFGAERYVVDQRDVSLPQKVPDPSQFQSDSQPQDEEFEDAKGVQDYGNPKAKSAVTRERYEPVEAHEQCQGAREVGNKKRVNERTRA